MVEQLLLPNVPILLLLLLVITIKLEGRKIAFERPQSFSQSLVIIH